MRLEPKSYRKVLGWGLIVSLKKVAQFKTHDTALANQQQQLVYSSQSQDRSKSKDGGVVVGAIAPLWLLGVEFSKQH